MIFELFYRICAVGEWTRLEGGGWLGVGDLGGVGGWERERGNGPGHLSSIF